MVKNFLKIEVGEHPDDLLEGEKDIVVLNLDNVVAMKHREYKGNEWYAISCVNNEHLYISVEEAKRIAKEVNVQL